MLDAAREVNAKFTAVSLERFSAVQSGSDQLSPGLNYSKLSSEPREGWQGAEERLEPRRGQAKEHPCRPQGQGAGGGGAGEGRGRRDDPRGRRPHRHRRRHRPGPPGPVKRPSRFPQYIGSLWRFCMGVQGA